MRTSLSLLVIADDHKRPHGGDRIAAVVQVLPAILAAVGMTARRLAFVVSIAVADLAANLTGREVHGVNIAIGGIGDERRHQRVEIAGRDVLRGGPDHVCARDHSCHGSAGRRTSLSSRRAGVGEAAAEPYHDAARHMLLTEVNVGLRDGRTQA